MKSLILIATLTSAVFAFGFNKGDVAPVANELYKKECGSCHFAYQPGLLPSKAWDKMMLNLGNHFGSDASLEKEDYVSISRYLNNNSAEKFMNYKRSARIVDSLRAGEVPESISKTPYIIKKHREIKASLIAQKEVKGLFNCAACHTTAQKGIYGERDILIPNHGRWKD